MPKPNPAPPEAPKTPKVTAADLRAKASVLIAEAEAMEAEQRARTSAPVSVTSDEGVTCLLLSTGELVNTDTRGLNATRFALHHHGQTFTHCGCDPRGAWLYRAG